MKKCSKCSTCKESSEFNKNSRNASGLSDWCKICNKNYRVKNKEKIQKWQAEYRKENKEYFSSYSKQYHKKRLKTDPKYKMAHLLRIRVSDALMAKRWNKNNSLKKYLGCSLKDFISHIESMFSFGMTWENHGKWHVDHIVPLSSAATAEDLYALCHYTNLQPLWALDNIRKGSSLTYASTDVKIDT